MSNTLNDDSTVAAIDAEIINEACLLKRIPVCKRTLQNLRASGHLPFIKLPGSRRILYYWESVKAALIRQQNTATK